MHALKRFWRSVFDIRPGEYGRTIFMSLYLMCVLFAYYILKPVSRAIFLNNFDIDKLPWLYVLIAGIGGVLAYLYTKMAVRFSLRRAVDGANIFCTGVLVLFWWLIQMKAAWIIYAFNIWVSLFSVILVSQGWLVAANVFTPREAKRLYGILGVGSVIGAAFGGQFTAVMVYYIGTTNLLLASAGMVVLSYIAYRFAIGTSHISLAGAKAAEEEEDFSLGEVLGNIRRTRHLQVIIAIISITFIVDVLVEFQFSAMAKQNYHGRDLTAFLGNFYGFWLNLVTFVLQLFLTSFVVSRFGVGGTLQIMPASIALASIAALLSPTLLATAAARLTEASTRYSFNKTGMELLYLPLPLELRNRTKAFVDVFVDRMARGMGGMILVFFTSVVALPFRYFAIVVLVFSLAWILLSVVAKREYMLTVRRRLELRRFDFEGSRVNVSDPATVAMLERTARSGQARQSAYALTVLGEAPGYDAGAIAGELAASPQPEVRAKCFELLRSNQDNRVVEAALAEIRDGGSRKNGEAVRQAVLYAIEVTGERPELARRLLDHPACEVRIAAMEAITAHADLAGEMINEEWIDEAAAAADPMRRRLAALALRAPGENGSRLQRLIDDADAQVAIEAMRAAGGLQNRDHVPALIRNLGNPRLRGAALDALAAYGPRITGSLGDVIEDETVPLAIRRQAPRALARIPDQRSVDLLLGTLRTVNLPLRGAVLKALNKLREADPKLNYHATWFVQQVHDEARYYFELYLALDVLRACETPQPATALLIRTLEDRLRDTLERVFRLLGLRYPPQQIYAAYLAINRRSTDDYTTALEFLDNVLERELKRVLLPLLDEDGMLAQRAHELFRIEPKQTVDAVRELMHSGDPWLAACAMAAAVELRMRDVTADIRQVGAESNGEVAEVARAAQLALA